MKWLIIILGVLSVVALSCNKIRHECLKAKVLRISCSSFVVQVLNRDSIGSYGWKDISGHGIYNNVFRVANSCKIGKWGKGEEFYFKINDALIGNNCMTCMMFDSPPVKSYIISNVTAGPCEDESIP